MLPKITKNFDKERESNDLTAVCKEKLNVIEQDRLVFENYIKKGIDYKNGNVNIEELD